MDLQHLRRDIEGNIEDARFLAFMTLYMSLEAEAKAELKRIVTLQDPILKLLFLRFLTHVPEKKAVHYICQLLEDDNAIVVDAARRAFEKNQCEGRLDVLVPLMHSTQSGAQCFAVEVLGREGRQDMVGTVLSLMKEADDNLLLTILMALRYVPSAQSIMPVLSYLTDPREEVRFRAALVCGTLFESEATLSKQPLVSLLKDPAGRVRRAAIWGLRRRLTKGDEKIFMAVGNTDPDPMVRQEAVGGLIAYPTCDVIFQLLQMVISERDRRVSLKCESALLSMPPKQLVEGLDDVLSRATGEVRHRAILLAASLQRGSRDYMNFLTKGLQKTTEDKDRLTYLEALGILGDPNAIPVLLNYVHASPIVAYVAMSSLLKLSLDSGPYLQFLETPGEPDLLKQVILRHLARRPHVPEGHKARIVAYLMTVLRGGNINMRYLAAQVLVHLAGSQAHEALLDALKVETDPASLQLLRNSLTEFFINDPKGYVRLLAQHHHDPVLFRELRMLLKGMIWSRADIVASLPALMSPDLTSVSVEWLAEQLLQGRVFLEDVLEVLETIPDPDKAIVALSQVLLKQPEVRLVISSQVCRYWLKSKNDAVRAAIVDLMGMASDASGIPVLVSVVCNDAMLPFHENAVRALGRIAGAAHD